MRDEALEIVPYSKSIATESGAPRYLRSRISAVALQAFSSERPGPDKMVQGRPTYLVDPVSFQRSHRRGQSNRLPGRCDAYYTVSLCLWGLFQASLPRSFIERSGASPGWTDTTCSKARDPRIVVQEVGKDCRSVAKCIGGEYDGF
jgi:hypothetical protein